MNRVASECLRRPTLAVLMLLAAGTASAQLAPARPIRFLVGNPPGGGQDIIARLIGAKITEALGVAVVVDNRPGAAGNVAAEVVSRAAPDGHTLLMIGFANATNVGLFRKLPFDLLADFSPITLVGQSTNFLLVPAASRVATMKELLAEARANPGRLNYGSGGNGTAPHLGTELLKRMAGVDLVHVPFKGGGQSMTALLGAQVDVLIANPLAALPQIATGRVRALAVTSLQRSSAAPQVPTVAEAGVPGYEVISWWGVVAPPRMDGGLVGQLHALVTRSLQSADIRSRFQSQGVESATSTPEALRDFLAREVAKWVKVIRDAGIEPI